MRHAIIPLIFLICIRPAPAQAVERLVDATGQASSFTTIEQAMVVSAPGDRILVLPGSYPSFLFSRGVQVVGMGTDASQVVVERISFHVSIPAVDYDASISNLTIQSSNPLDVLVLSGNELAAGTLVLDHVDIQGGVFLRGGDNGFYVLVNDSRITPPAGHGFSGEACWLGGPDSYVEVLNSTISGWNADPTQFATAGAGLRLGGGTSARLCGSVIRGGDGSAVGAPWADGASGVVHAAPGLVNLRIDGGSTLLGGQGAAGGAGGDGVAIAGNILLGQASVFGGVGTPAGVPFGLAPPVLMTTEVSMAIQPARVNAQGVTHAGPGETVSFAAATPTGTTAIVLSFGLHVPQSGLFVAIDPAIQNVYMGNAVSGVVPSVPGANVSGLMLYAQAFHYEPSSGQWLSSATGAMRIDL
ncbi:MAG TPA: hypothetical protein ENK43_14750 [Planctomycetes bacterium]|nr:hypothetical protein [Planctomycetota bacterium]